jgi:Holliday junction resolvase RusA-like endonuclease
MKEIILKFNVKPMAKQSFRTTRKGYKYLDASVMKYRKTLRTMARIQMREQKAEKLDGAISIEILYAFQRPQSLRKKERSEIDSGKSMPKTTKPDIDNLTKAILDALNGIAWNDDAQVAQITAKKVWSKQDQIEVKIMQIKNQIKQNQTNKSEKGEKK